MLSHMKRLGIDFGSKKIGIALTDDSGSMAFPHAVIPNDAEYFTYIEKLIQERGVEEVVIGHSLNNKGEPNKIHAAVEVFVTDITLAIGIPVHLEPEQYSTRQASHIQGKTNLTDASAAAVILDSFITKQNK
jgi:putative Holliday junction resolvase